MSTAWAPLLVSNAILQTQKPELLEEVDNCRDGTGNIEEDPKETYNGKEEVLGDKPPNNEVMSKGCRTNLKNCQGPKLEQSEQPK